MPFVDVTFTNGELSDEELIELINPQIIVTSTVEGGPLCVVEAIAMGNVVLLTLDGAGNFHALSILTRLNLQNSQ